MKKLLQIYRSYSFEQKTLLNTKISLIFNILLALGKIILAFFSGIFFAITAILNLFIFISKLECYLGIKYPTRRTFTYRNTMIGVFLLLAGVQYTLYMALFAFFQFHSMIFDFYLGIAIAIVSFVELTIAIIGCFKAYNKGHYYRNIKMLNLCSALTAMVLTETAIMSFASNQDQSRFNGLFGMCMGILLILMGIFVFLAPKFSIIDREHNVYVKKMIKKEKTIFSSKKPIKILLTNSKIYGNYYYEASYKDGIIDGHIKKEKSPILSWHISVKIIFILLSEILIFFYGIGALVFYFANGGVIKRLDEIMLHDGFVKVTEEEQ